MTLVTYLRKSFSIREDDSRAPHFSPTLCQYNRLDRLVWEGLGFFFLFFSQFNLELFREDLLYFFQGIRVVKKTGFENQFFQKLVFKKKKKQRNLEGKKKPTLFTRPFCKCRPQIRADSIFFPTFFPRLVEPWLNHGSAFGKWLFLDFFLPAAPFLIFCSAKKGSFEWLCGVKS